MEFNVEVASVFNRPLLDYVLVIKCIMGFRIKTLSAHSRCTYVQEGVITPDTINFSVFIVVMQFAFCEAVTEFWDNKYINSVLHRLKYVSYVYF
jgi:hypothetical protein